MAPELPFTDTVFFSTSTNNASVFYSSFRPNHRQDPFRSAKSTTTGGTHNGNTRHNAKILQGGKETTIGKPGHRRYVSQFSTRLLIILKYHPVEHKVRQFEAWLSDTLENFRIHQEGQVSRVPKLVRALTMREFGEKYNGDVQAALRGLQRERMGVGGEPGGAGDIEIDKSTRKRKWVASVEAEAEGSKSFKNGMFISLHYAYGSSQLFICSARMASPNKKPGSSTGPGTAQRARLLASNRTPGTVSTLSSAIQTHAKFYAYSRGQWDASQPPQAPANQPVH
jgi:Nbl1 / Borealin N terminal